jgi:cbb3-type cytochrome oxidase cytochrome c subunit
MSVCVHNIIYINITVMVLLQGKIISAHSRTHTHTHIHAHKILNHLLVSFHNIYIQDSASPCHQLMVSIQKIQQSFTLQTQ